MERQMVILGQEVTVRDRISYKEKLDAAEEHVARIAVFDEENGLCYVTHLDDAIKTFTMLKVYTNMDMSEYDSLDGICELADKMAEENTDNFYEFIQRDFDALMDLSDKLYYNVMNVFEQTHSLAHRFAKSFGFLFDGKDLTETLAEAREVSEQMIDHLGAIQKTNTIDMAQYAKKKNK